MHFTVEKKMKILSLKLHSIRNCQGSISVEGSTLMPKVTFEPTFFLNLSVLRLNFLIFFLNSFSNLVLYWKIVSMVTLGPHEGACSRDNINEEIINKLKRIID